MDRDFLKHRRVVVMGLGRFGGGLDSARFAAASGAHVLVTDLAQEAELADTLKALDGLEIEYRLGEHRDEDFRSADVLIVNPAVPPGNRYLALARESAVLITSQMELFFKMCPARIVGITGVNGKSTTTSLAAELLKAGRGQKGIGYKNVRLGGNIGHQPLLAGLDEIGKADIVVLEISNFQLEQLERIEASPHIALITNLTPNHLDRHGTFEEYCRVKETIFRFQTHSRFGPAVSIFNGEDAITRGWFDAYSGRAERRCILYSADDVPQPIRDAYTLPGRANRSNLAGALAIAGCFGVEEERLVAATARFEGLANRCQFVAQTDGVKWYNDSKATTPVSTMAALNGIDEPKILIAGGYDKKISFEELGACIAQRAKAAVLIGQTAKSIAEAVAGAGPTACAVRFADSMEQAVRTARQLAAAGDVVLMSPACASYDMFKNYEQRAQAFAAAIRGLS